jgi:hypothetical protein
MVHKPESHLLHVTEELHEHIDREPPALLCHYTNQHGLLGIVSTGEIWATSVDNLNDRKELSTQRNWPALLSQPVSRVSLTSERKGTLATCKMQQETPA